MSSIKGTFTVLNKRGLHARAASRLVELASSFPCQVDIQKGGQTANAKSVMGVLMLCGTQGTQVTILADGDSAEEAVRSIGELINSRFGEED